jgi:hypothetical protein
LLVAQQLGSAYLLLFMVGIAVLYTTHEVRVVKSYLVALLIADLVHMALTFNALLDHGAWEVRTWNIMTWGNIGAVIFLALTRIAYLTGLFGDDRPSRGGVKKLQ